MSQLRTAGTATVPINATTVISMPSMPVRVFALHIVSGGSVGSVALYDANSATNEFATFVGTAGTGRTFMFGKNGVHFPDGLTVFANSNCTQVLVSFSQ